MFFTNTIIFKIHGTTGLALRIKLSFLTKKRRFTKYGNFNYLQSLVLKLFYIDKTPEVLHGLNFHQVAIETDAL